MVKTDGVKVFWVFKIQSDKQLAHAEITVVVKNQVLVDVAIPGDGQVEAKEFEKGTK